MNIKSLLTEKISFHENDPATRKNFDPLNYEMD